MTHASKAIQERTRCSAGRVVHLVVTNARTSNALVRKRIVRARAIVVVVAVRVFRALIARIQRHVITLVRIVSSCGAHISRARVVVRAHGRRVDALAVHDLVDRARIGVVAATFRCHVLALGGMAQAILSADEATLTVGLRRTSALVVHAGVDRAGIAIFAGGLVADHGSGLFLVDVDVLDVAAAPRAAVAGVAFGDVDVLHAPVGSGAGVGRSLVRHVTRRAGVVGLDLLVGDVRARPVVSVGFFADRGATCPDTKNQNR